jgi:hypothetical protein
MKGQEASLCSTCVHEGLGLWLHYLHNLRAREGLGLARLRRREKSGPLVQYATHCREKLVGGTGGVHPLAPLPARMEASRVQDAPKAQDNHEGGGRLVSAVRKDAEACLSDDNSNCRRSVEPQNQVSLLILLREGHVLRVGIALGNKVLAVPGGQRRAEKILWLLARKDTLAVMGGEHQLARSVLNVAARWRPQAEGSCLLRA